MGGSTGGTGGGGTQTVKFSPNIQTDIDTLGCPGCHSVGAGNLTLKANASSANDIDANYSAFKNFCNTSAPAQSTILQANLSNSGITPPHPATPFASNTDPVYQRWLNWIMSGEVKQ
jgi:hypothetical protein